MGTFTTWRCRLDSAYSPLRASHVITCAHTLEKIRRSALLKSPTCTSATLFLSGHHDEPMFASEVLTCLPRFDLVIYSIDPHDRQTRSFDTIQPLSISMYPFPPGMPITTRFYPKSVGTTDYDAPFGTWTPEKVTGYRDWAGSEAEPGSYDTLAHLLFLPTPTPGTSGAPIIDANTGAVVGIVTGSRMHNRVEGLQGWATPAEAIFNMFSLPGMPSERRGTN
ncbi:hypothetical protein FRB93_003368 [Tulasnella sp. JGI-2019a]|nr:hypothetical protein FRB93_003368 [Tulasnella sp. JGI-2019a]